jgi:hypothetical protein
MKQAGLGYVAAKIQAAQGTFETPDTFLSVLSGSLGANTELVIPDSEIKGSHGRLMSEADVGTINYGGGYEFYFRPNSGGLMVLAAMGQDSVTTLGGGAYRHTITVSGTNYWLSLQERIGQTIDTFNYTDAKCNGLTLSNDVNDYLKGEVDFLAITQSGGATAQSVTEDTSPKFMSHVGVVELEDTTLRTKTFKLEINNNLVDDDFSIGSRILGDIVEGNQEFTGTLNIRPDDSDLYKKAVYGSESANEPTNDIYQGSFSIEYTSPTMIASTAYPYRIKIEAGSCNFKPFKYEPKNNDPIEHDLEIVPFLPGDGNEIVTITIDNAIADYLA